jgi:signal transduction histidine kinase
LLAVRNQGSRLPATLHEQLFDSLVSLREGGEAGRHLGLGLHIVRLVAEAHHGRVQASNLPDGQGVEFRITLPAAS